MYYTNIFVTEENLMTESLQPENVHVWSIKLRTVHVSFLQWSQPVLMYTSICVTEENLMTEGLQPENVHVWSIKFRTVHVSFLQ
jgi:hypothetical protein